MADAEDSKSSVGNHMRVQVPPSAPIFSPTVFGYLAQMTLAVKSPARESRLTLAELWLFARNHGMLTRSGLNCRPSLQHP
jgi:hypothetical protein